MMHCTTGEKVVSDLRSKGTVPTVSKADRQRAIDHAVRIVNSGCGFVRRKLEAGDITHED